MGLERAVSQPSVQAVRMAGADEGAVVLSEKMTRAGAREKVEAEDTGLRLKKPRQLQSSQHEASGFFCGWDS